MLRNAPLMSIRCTSALWPALLGVCALSTMIAAVPINDCLFLPPYWSSSSRPLLAASSAGHSVVAPPFTALCHPVEQLVDLPYLPAGWSNWLYFGALTIVFSVDFVHGCDFECCNICTT